MLVDRLKSHKVYLASKSPRRHELLNGMGVDFEYLPLDVEEDYSEELTPVEVAEYLSQLKLSPIAYDFYEKGSIFIACDTIVVLNGRIIGKPVDLDDAKKILRELSGNEHTVISGLSVAMNGKLSTAHKETLVKFKPLSDEEIDYYVDRYRPLDKAGAYGIQEWIGYIGIEYVEGSFYNIMGLPTRLLWEMLEAIVDG
ncbi:Maf family nucleotide pyrophosphatase [Bacteroidales bacterium OttesenSCG-928-B11]|nr:Maf family nucleotide pyrophosphatase [Bacteroidales bacterium OttesenSCG-928-E04]MDL2313041.1 Maf family nucleotide pyrophosphatase [Bacteroidales bacterium OttesenSCG-928-B11]MDL2326965.1 Maf family nucleotide pyrophosphatase [Bacteroidales bacterium OttesenSCG-928-A14]